MANPIWQWKKVSYDFVEYSSPILKGILHFRKFPAEEKNQMLFEKFDISMSKKFIYFPNEGWSWHKIWNIPSICVDLQKMKSDLDPKRILFMGLYLIKKIERNEEIFMNLGLTGNTILNLTENSKQNLLFSSIKINTTSFCHNGEKFQFLLTLFEECFQKKKCLLSLISPEFLVDSRELNKNNSNSKLKNINLFIEPFAPGFISKELFKRENRIIKEKKEIENSLEGLYHYLSSPNIKFKIKHPLFLLFKFSNVFSLYYKQKNVGKEENMIEKIQKTIMQNYQNFLVKRNLGKEKNEDFILLVKEFEIFDRRQKHKLTDFLGFLNNHFISIVKNTIDIPPLYGEYKNLVFLRKIYKKTFNKLNLNNLSCQIKSQKLHVKKQLIKKLIKNKKEIWNKKIKPDECSSNINLISKNLQKVSIVKNIEFSTFSQNNQIQIISSVHSKIKDNTIKEEKLNFVLQDEKKCFEYPIKLKNKLKKVENCIENYYDFLSSTFSKSFQTEIRLF